MSLISAYEKTKLNIGEFPIEKNNCEKLLGIKIDNKLTFVNTLANIAPFTNIYKRRILMNSFLRS